MSMMSLRYAFITIALLAVATAAIAQPTQKQTVGQFIDDTAITTQIKAKLTGDKLSNLTKIEVKTANGVVTLNGTVDSAERSMRAEQIASSVNGVQGVVNNIHVAGTTVHPPAGAIGSPVAQAPVDAIGVVAHVDSASGRITLQDGRVLQATPGTVIWQAATMQSVRPGTQVLVRGAAPLAAQPTTPQWRMGTVRSVDRARYQLVLTDGTLVRVAPYANVRRGGDRLALEQIVPGSEVAIRTLPPVQGSAEGSALPGHMVVIDASEINVVWEPSARLR
jgi:hypothetical protein